MVPKHSFFDIQQRKLFLTLNIDSFFPQGKTHLSLSFFIAAENFSFFSETILCLSLFSEKLIILMQKVRDLSLNLKL